MLLNNSNIFLFYNGSKIKKRNSAEKRRFKMKKIVNLSINDFNIEMLKSLDIAYFQNKSTWLTDVSPVGNNEVRPRGYELYAEIKTYIIPEKPFEFSVSINEKMTDKEIQDELENFEYLTNGFRYTVF